MPAILVILIGMTKFKLKDERLGKRWLTLVSSFIDESCIAFGGEVKILPSETKAFGAAQADWRFYNNDRVELSELVVPFGDFAKEKIGQSQARFLLLAHNWCMLSFPGHKCD